MSRQYERPEARDGGLRLHLNENTAGCSPRVQRVLSDLTREQAAFYPDYDAAIAASAAHFGVSRDRVVLTNGLDDGIMLASLVALRGATAADPFEAIVVQPAFDMYGACADALRIVVAHHPLMRPALPTLKPTLAVRRSAMALDAFDRMGVRLVLSGHFHLSFVRKYDPNSVRDGIPRGPRRAADTPVLVCQASSTISNRLRGQPNAYNLIDIKDGLIDIRVREWGEGVWETREEAEVAA